MVDSGARNLILFVLENGTYEITGNQPIPGAGRLDFAGLARAAGFPRVYSFEDGESYEISLGEILSAPGPVFVRVAMKPGSEGPISRGPGEEARYLKTSLADCALRFREALRARP